MRDPKEILESVLLDLDAKRGGENPKIYQDEPLLMTASQMKKYTPPMYREMRKIAKNNIYYESDAKIFYKQGKLMEDFEDDYEYKGEFLRYYPTYQSMNDFQLRGYFSWRTKVRRGIIEETSISYVYVYLYELLNLIGVRSPEDGFHKMIGFWRVYREINPKITYYAKRWLRDFVIYYNLDKHLLSEITETELDDSLLTLLNYEDSGEDAVFQALNARSTYHFENSRFYKQNQKLVKTIVFRVYSALWTYFERNGKQSLCELLFGKMTVNTYLIFQSAVFYHQIKHRDFIYEINDIYKYKCQNGSWTCERFFGSGSRSKEIGALMKNIDFCLRMQQNYKSTLKKAQTSKLFMDVIHQEIERYAEEERRKAIPKIEIDLSKLQSIRDTSMETQDKLIVEEDPYAGSETVPPDIEGEAVPESEAAQEPARADMEYGLNEAERIMLHALLYDEQYEVRMRALGIMPSVLVDGINEKLYEEFGDTVIVYEGETPELLEDYIEELKGIIKE